MLRLICAVALAMLIAPAAANSAIIFQSSILIDNHADAELFLTYYDLNTNTFAKIFPTAINAEEQVGWGGAAVANPNPPLPAVHNYQLTLVLPTAPISLTTTQTQDWWFDDFVFFQGRYVQAGGSDNIASPDHVPIAPFSINGNIWTYRFNDAVTFTYNFPFWDKFLWSDGGLIMADFPDSAIGQYVQITVSTVPEPATWGLLIVGFAAIGGALRLNRRRSRVLKSS